MQTRMAKVLVILLCASACERAVGVSVPRPEAPPAVGEPQTQDPGPTTRYPISPALPPAPLWQIIIPDAAAQSGVLQDSGRLVILSDSAGEKIVPGDPQGRPGDTYHIRSFDVSRVLKWSLVGEGGMYIAPTQVAALEDGSTFLSGYPAGGETVRLGGLEIYGKSFLIDIDANGKVSQASIFYSETPPTVISYANGRRAVYYDNSLPFVMQPNRLEVTREDGTVLWSRGMTAHADPGFTSGWLSVYDTELLGDGRLVVVGLAVGAVLDGWRLGNDYSGTMLMFSPEGRVEWALPLEGFPSAFVNVAVDEAGIIYASGGPSDKGTAQWGASTLRSGYDPYTQGSPYEYFVVAATPSGEPLWARSVETGHRLAAHPSGGVVVGGMYYSSFDAEYCQSRGLTYLAPDGTVAWERPIVLRGWKNWCISGQLIPMSNHEEIVVAGVVNGTVDFGLGKVETPEDRTKSSTMFILGIPK